MKLKTLLFVPLAACLLATGCNQKNPKQAALEEAVAEAANLFDAKGNIVYADKTSRLASNSYLIGIDKYDREDEKVGRINPSISWSFSDNNWKLMDYYDGANVDEWHVKIRPTMPSGETEFTTTLTLKMEWEGFTATSEYHVTVYKA